MPQLLVSVLCYPEPVLPAHYLRNWSICLTKRENSISNVSVRRVIISMTHVYSQTRNSEKINSRNIDRKYDRRLRQLKKSIPKLYFSSLLNIIIVCVCVSVRLASFIDSSQSCRTCPWSTKCKSDQAGFTEWKFFRQFNLMEKDTPNSEALIANIRSLLLVWNSSKDKKYLSYFLY